jgi:hypothetical protein
MMKDSILSPELSSLCHRLTDEEVSKKQIRSVLIKATGPANRKKLILIFFAMALNEVPGLLLPLALHDLVRS